MLFFVFQASFREIPTQKFIILRQIRYLYITTHLSLLRPIVTSFKILQLHDLGASDHLQNKCTTLYNLSYCDINNVPQLSSRSTLYTKASEGYTAHEIVYDEIVLKAVTKEQLPVICVNHLNISQHPITHLYSKNPSSSVSIYTCRLPATSIHRSC